ncbi:MAG: low molecular weight protein arginine phosphatase [Defluviitaleaceae bacterium]|nr:low molecular weight protein arginine phosphatase [Defluviitaleaceae bacterium]
MTKKEILFVCTGNTCRSPMAAALACKMFDSVSASSAGMAADMSAAASFGARAAMLSEGIDISGHFPRQVDLQMMEHADIVLAMAAHHKKSLCAMFFAQAKKIHTLGDYAGGNFAGLDVSDPYGMDLNFYLECAALLKAMLGACEF